MLPETYKEIPDEGNPLQEALNKEGYEDKLNTSSQILRMGKVRDSRDYQKLDSTKVKGSKITLLDSDSLKSLRQ